MTLPEILLFAAQIPILGLVLFALLVGLRLHRQSQEQLLLLHQRLDSSRDSVKTQNILYALSLLRDEDFRRAVMVVRSRLRGRRVDSWEAADTIHVLLVCSTYNLVGLLLKHEVVPRQLFLEHWGASVLDMYGALEEFINRRRRAHPDYCADFLWLCEQSLAAQRSAAPSGALPLQKPHPQTAAQAGS